MRILFLCDFARPFTGADFHGPGVGGTEAAVVVAAEALARAGHAAAVAVRGAAPCVHAGVRYLPLEAAPREAADAAVLVKRWTDAAEGVRAPARAFFCTDVHVDDPAAAARAVRWAGRVLMMSRYQRRAVARALPALAARPVEVVGLPVALGDYAGAGGERDDVLLYCSVPDRGLVHLARVFPYVRRRVPTARLVVTSDLTLWGKEPVRDAYLRFFGRAEGVTYAGHVARPELVRWQRQARVMAYPCTFPEGFCLAAAECMAAGAVPVTSRAFALPETVGAGGVLVGGRPGGWLWRRRLARALVRVLRDRQGWERRSAAARGAAERFDPDRWAARLVTLLSAPPAVAA